jgi:hypothetical protein
MQEVFLAVALDQLIWVGRAVQLPAAASLP